ncbi:beta-lactamase family protein [Hymenobacter sp. J193]|uniref:serine hydrolase domain-containing protein n=1 Tax=Hymenobacter sp. J193 TaxID=2898429 RepID=UPI0021517B0E|nr:serine hydrolase domain-containing protein [Hymenobacter sp. J193]MCR5887364.1 beta-lactamase family protein [Hymenobacter sp. J193]
MKRFLALAALLSLPLLGVAQATAPDSLTAQLSRLASASGLPGFGVAVVSSTGILYEHGFGYANRQARQPYSTGTMQNVGSVSKTFIGVALLKAVEQGLFSLDTPINKVLPFAVHHPQAPAQPITIRQLATHTSGIIDREAAYRKAYVPRTTATAALDSAERHALARRQLAAFLREYLSPKGRTFRPANFSPDAPGTAYHYSNIGAALAAYLIELKSGLSFAEYTRRYIFEPLKMQDSGWLYEPRRANRYAVNYKPSGKPLRPYSLLTYPDGGLLTTPHDLGLYLAEILRGAAGQPSPLLTPTSFQAMLGPQFAAASPPRNLNPKEPNSGIFWAIRRNGQIGHTGSDPGASSFMFYNPQTGIGKVFITNVALDENEVLTKQFSAIWQLLDTLPAAK